MSEPVVVVDYDAEWPRTFERLRERISEAVGDLALSIEHVGSTAVPGLAAKPVIDMDVVVRSSDDVPAVIERLASLGYEHQGDAGVPGREAFDRPASEDRHHLYVVVHGSRAYLRHIVIREYLRSHPDEAAVYAALKRELAETYRDDRDAYTKAKDSFTDRVFLEHQGEYAED